MNTDQPFGQPPGTVRGILALTLGIGGSIALAAMAWLFPDVREIIVGAFIVNVSLIPRYYFDVRANATSAPTPPTQ